MLLSFAATGIARATWCILSLWRLSELTRASHLQRMASLWKSDMVLHLFTMYLAVFIISVFIYKDFDFRQNFNEVLGREMDDIRRPHEFCGCTVCRTSGDATWQWEMKTGRETYCCMETLSSTTVAGTKIAGFIRRAIPVGSEQVGRNPCITSHPQFSKLCLDIDVGFLFYFACMWINKMQVLELYGGARGIVAQRTADLTDVQWRSAQNRSVDTRFLLTIIQSIIHFLHM